MSADGTLRYIEQAVTLELDADAVQRLRPVRRRLSARRFAMDGRRAALADRGACLECGACALNCVPGAISVTPGVGCAQAIIIGWLTGGEPSCDCG